MGNQRLENHNGGALYILLYAREVARDDCFIPRDTALNAARAGAVQVNAIGAYIFHRLTLHPHAHGQHGDEHADSAGDADHDGQNRPHSLCGAPLNWTRKIPKNCRKKFMTLR